MADLLSIDVVEHAVEGEVPPQCILLRGAKGHLWNAVGCFAGIGLRAQVDQVDLQLIHLDLGSLQVLGLLRVGLYHSNTAGGPSLQCQERAIFMMEMRSPIMPCSVDMFQMGGAATSIDLQCQGQGSGQGTWATGSALQWSGTKQPVQGRCS